MEIKQSYSIPTQPSPQRVKGQGQETVGVQDSKKNAQQETCWIHMYNSVVLQQISSTPTSVLKPICVV